MKVSRQTSATGTGKTQGRSSTDPLLPHEVDQEPESQEEHEPRSVGKQAHRDLERGLEDTDRRGGDDYQKRTQRDADVNANSRKKQQP